MVETTSDQRFMAAMFGLNTRNSSSWPMETINELVDIDNKDGRQAALKEIDEKYRPPLKSNNEIIADMIVEKLIAKGIIK